MIATDGTNNENFKKKNSTFTSVTVMIGLLFLIVFALLAFGDVSKITQNLAKGIKTFKKHFEDLENDNKKNLK